MCTFANQIKTIKLFKYEKNASKYSLFELSTPNNSTFIDAHTGHFMSTPVFVHVPVFLHTRTQQLRVAPDEKDIVAVCVHLQIK